MPADGQVKLMIAYRCHYETTNLRAVKLIRDGAIGTCNPFKAPTDSIAAQGNGGSICLGRRRAMMDVGIYSLNANRYLTGEEPSLLQPLPYSDPSDPRFKTVEENLVWITKFPSGITANCATSLRRQHGRYVPGHRLERLDRSRPGLWLLGSSSQRRCT